MRSGFDEVGEFPLGSTVGAVIVVRLKPELQCFALSFGVTGRYLLKQEAWQRGYGLQTALESNLSPRRNRQHREARCRRCQAAQWRCHPVRRQATSPTVFEAFDVDKLRISSAAPPASLTTRSPGAAHHRHGRAALRG